MDDFVFLRQGRHVVCSARRDLFPLALCLPTPEAGRKEPAGLRPWQGHLHFLFLGWPWWQETGARGSTGCQRKGSLASKDAESRGKEASPKYVLFQPTSPITWTARAPRPFGGEPMTAWL